MAQKVLKLCEGIHEFMMNVFQDSGKQLAMYQDTRLECRDGSFYSNRILLSLALPFLGRNFALLGETIEPVILLPDYSTEEVKTSIHAFLSNHEDDGIDTSEHINTDTDDFTQSKVEIYDDQYEIKNETEIKDEISEHLELEAVDIYNPDLAYKCSYCVQSFATKAERCQHEKSYIGEDGQLRCKFEECENRSFKNRKCLVRHVNEIHYDNGRRSLKVTEFSCYFCGDYFTSRLLYKKHMKKYKHGPKRKDYKCPEEGCEKRFRVNHVLLDHIRKHRGIYEFSCDECGKPCTTKYTLKSHMLMHATNSQIICDICSKVFKHKILLGQHVSKTHATEEERRRYKCDQCDKAYPKKDKLRDHMFTHTGDRNFTCPTCGKKFMTKPTLITHEKTHSGVKPYQCDICEKSFVSSFKVKRHKLIHTGVMDFSCAVCGKQFNQKTNKNTHEKKCKEYSGDGKQGIAQQ